VNPIWRERLKKLAPKLGYPAFYLFCLGIFLSWTFPYDKLKERIVAQFNAQQRTASNPQQLEVDDLDSHWITGVKAKGVRLIQPSKEADKPPTVIAIDEARARISLLGLLVGNRNVSFRIDAFDGVIKGTYEESSKEREIEVTFEDVDVARVDAIAANAGFPLDGKLNGELKLLLPEGKASKGNGTVNLEIKEMAAGKGTEFTVKTPMGPFTLPKAKIGTFTITGEAKDGKLTLSKIASSGGDLDLAGDGRVQLREVATDANLDVNLKFKVNDSYRGKNEKTKLLFGTPGGKDKPMVDMMLKSKTNDGFYNLRVGGTLGNPKPDMSGPPSLGGGPKAFDFK
jgi:type II secretion system protein N